MGLRLPDCFFSFDQIYIFFSHLKFIPGSRGQVGWRHMAQLGLLSEASETGPRGPDPDPRGLPPEASGLLLMHRSQTREGVGVPPAIVQPLAWSPSKARPAAATPRAGR